MEVVNIYAPAHLPEGASKPVEHSFASFSFPVHFFADYAGWYTFDQGIRPRLIEIRK